MLTRTTAVVKHGGLVQILSPALGEGTNVEVIVLTENDEEAVRQ